MYCRRILFVIFTGTLILLLCSPRPVVQAVQNAGHELQQTSQYQEFVPDKLSSVTVIDIDGNVYNTVKIGDQLWTVQNLKVTRFNDGTPIPLVTDQEKWSTVGEQPAFCYYDDNPSNNTVFGALYNWYAVNTQKLAPKGWHVPSDAEWTAMENYLIAHGYNWDGTKSGNKIAKALAAKNYWKEQHNIYGAIGNVPEKNNRTMFSALPGGFRRDNGYFCLPDYNGSWWSATEYAVPYAYFRSLGNSSEGLYGDVYNKRHGYSVRLLRD